MFKLLWVDHYDYGQFMAAAKVTWQRFVAVGIDLSGEKEDYWIKRLCFAGRVKITLITLSFYTMTKMAFIIKTKTRFIWTKNQRAIVTKFLRRFRSVNGWK